LSGGREIIKDNHSCEKREKGRGIIQDNVPMVCGDLINCTKSGMDILLACRPMAKI